MWSPLKVEKKLKMYKTCIQTLFGKWVRNILAKNRSNICSRRMVIFVRLADMIERQKAKRSIYEESTTWSRDLGSANNNLNRLSSVIQIRSIVFYVYQPHIDQNRGKWNANSQLKLPIKTLMINNKTLKIYFTHNMFRVWFEDWSNNYKHQ